MTLALMLACTIIRRWRGVVLAAMAVPIAIGLTEYVLKPSVGEAIGQAFPSGHATSSFALATIFAVLLASPPCRRVPGAIRLLLGLVAFLLAAAVAAVMVATGAHYLHRRRGRRRGRHRRGPGLRAYPGCSGQPAAARTSGATSSCRVISGGSPGRMPGPAAAAHAVATSGSRPPCPPSSRCPWSVTTTIVQSSSGPDGRERTAATSRPTRWSAARRAAR